MGTVSAGINVTSCLSFTGFESILEGLFGPGLVKDITLFQGKHAKQTNQHLQIQLYTNAPTIVSNANGSLSYQVFGSWRNTHVMKLWGEKMGTLIKWNKQNNKMDIYWEKNKINLFYQWQCCLEGLKSFSSCALESFYIFLFKKKTIDMCIQQELSSQFSLVLFSVRDTVDLQ